MIIFWGNNIRKLYSGQIKLGSLLVFCLLFIPLISSEAKAYESSKVEVDSGISISDLHFENAYVHFHRSGISEYQELPSRSFKSNKPSFFSQFNLNKRVICNSWYPRIATSYSYYHLPLFIFFRQLRL